MTLVRYAGYRVHAADACIGRSRTMPKRERLSQPRFHIADGASTVAYLQPLAICRHHSSAVEQLIRNEQVLGSSPSGGSSMISPISIMEIGDFVLLPARIGIRLHLALIWPMFVRSTISSTVHASSSQHSPCPSALCCPLVCTVDPRSCHSGAGGRLPSFRPAACCHRRSIRYPAENGDRHGATPDAVAGPRARLDMA